MNVLKRVILTGLIPALVISQLYVQAEDSDESVVELKQYIVSAGPLVDDLKDIALPATVLDKSNLKRSAQSTLGETLSNQPGINSSYFGPGASRPIIRGFDGERVRVLTSDIDSFDVSNTSPDHAVGIEPLLTERVEIVRGAATLLYGNSAIGGIVNVIGKDIPREKPEAPLSGNGEFRFGTAADEVSGVVSIEGAAGNFAWHVGGAIRESEDVEIPGFAESARFRALEEAEREVEDEVSGVLENSAVETESGTAGFAWFWDKGTFGASVSTYNSLYGVPRSHGHEEEGEEELVSIDLEQYRFDLRAEIREPVLFLESTEFRLGVVDYMHTELEGDAVGTQFDRDGVEARILAVHQPMVGFNGVLGFNFKHDDFAAIGDEAFIPSNETLNWALFIVERAEFDWGSWEFGFRYENQEIDPGETVFRKGDESTLNVSTGLVYNPADEWAAASSITFSQRAPSATELLAFGPHVATQSFEIGNMTLNLEEAFGLDLSLRKMTGFITGSVNFYYNAFDNFIYLNELELEEAETRFGELEAEGFGIFEYTESEATFYGLEAEATLHFIDTESKRLHLIMTSDFVRATNESIDTPLPRIPPWRFGTRLEQETPTWTAGIAVSHHGEQDRVAPGEFLTDSYTFLNADFAYRLQFISVEWEVFVIGKNLTDAEGRVHSSVLKDVAPLPGWNITTGIRLSF